MLAMYQPSPSGFGQLELAFVRFIGTHFPTSDIRCGKKPHRLFEVFAQVQSL
jgi:hypothetical protein